METLKKQDERRDKVHKMIGHELREPLATMNLAIDTLLTHADGYLNEEQTATLKRLKRACWDEILKVEHLLERARIETGKIGLKLVKWYHPI